jgi:hypothetical protein
MLKNNNSIMELKTIITEKFKNELKDSLTKGDKNCKNIQICERIYFVKKI